MTTTGELRGIIEELEFVDGGDAESYLGEEVTEGGEGDVCIIGGVGRSGNVQEEERNFLKELMDVAGRAPKLIDRV